MTDTGNTEKISRPFDLEGLNQLYGKDTVGELLQMSVDEASGLIKQIEDGITLHDSKVVAVAAHQLKGLASTMTINHLAALTAQLEALAREERWDDISTIEKTLKAEFDTVASYIGSVLQKQT